MRKPHRGVTTGEKQGGQEARCPVLDPGSNAINKEEDHHARNNAAHPAGEVIDRGIPDEEPDQILLIGDIAQDFRKDKDNTVAYKGHDIKECRFIVMGWREVACGNLQAPSYRIDLIRGKISRLGKSVTNPCHP